MSTSIVQMCRWQTLRNQSIGDAQQNAIATAKEPPDGLSQNKPDVKGLVIVACVKGASARRLAICEGRGKESHGGSQMHMLYVSAMTAPTTLAARIRRRLNRAQRDAYGNAVMISFLCQFSTLSNQTRTVWTHRLTNDGRHGRVICIDHGQVLLYRMQLAHVFGQIFI
jgi:hypothetical protein